MPCQNYSHEISYILSSLFCAEHKCLYIVVVSWLHPADGLWETLLTTGPECSDDAGGSCGVQRGHILAQWLSSEIRRCRPKVRNPFTHRSWWRKWCSFWTSNQGRSVLYHIYSWNVYTYYYMYIYLFVRPHLCYLILVLIYGLWL